MSGHLLRLDIERASRTERRRVVRHAHAMQDITLIHSPPRAPVIQYTHTHTHRLIGPHKTVLTGTRHVGPTSLQPTNQSSQITY